LPTLGTLGYHVVELPVEGGAASPRHPAGLPAADAGRQDGDVPCYRVEPLSVEEVAGDARRRMHEAEVIQLQARRKDRERRRQASRGRETRWHHCLFYPFLAWRYELGLAVALAVFTGVLVHWLFEADDVAVPLLLLPTLPLVLIACHGCAFLQAALRSAA